MKTNSSKMFSKMKKKELFADAKVVLEKNDLVKLEQLIIKYNSLFNFDLIIFLMSNGLIFSYDFKAEKLKYKMTNDKEITGYKAEDLVCNISKYLDIQSPESFFVESSETGDVNSVLIGVNYTHKKLSAASRQVFKCMCINLENMVTTKLLFEKLSSYQANLSFLYETNKLLNSGKDYETILSGIIKNLSEMLQAESGGILLYEPQSERLVLQKPAFGVNNEEIINNHCVSIDRGTVSVEVFTSGKPYISNNAQTDPRYSQRYIKTFHVHKTISVPLQIENRTIGVLHLINKQEGYFQDQDVHILTILASQIAGTIERARMLEEIKRQEQDTKTLYEVGLEISSKILKLDNLLDIVVEKTCFLLSCDMALVAMKKAEKNYYIQSIYGDDIQELLNIEVSIDEDLWYKGKSTSIPHFIDLDTIVDNGSGNCNLDLILKQKGFCSVASVSLGNTGEKSGLLLCCYKGRQRFDRRHVNLLARLSSQLTVAFEKTCLYEQKEKTVQDLEEFNRIVEEQSKTLRKSLNIHNELTRTVINSRGLESIADTLSALVDCSVIVLDQSFRQLVFSDNHKQDEDNLTEKIDFKKIVKRREVRNVIDDIVMLKCPQLIPPFPKLGLHKSSLVAPILVYGIVEGYVVINIDKRESNELDLLAIEHAASAFALEIIRKKMIYKVDKRIKGDYFHELISGQYHSKEEILNRAEILEIDLINTNYQFMVLEVKKKADKIENTLVDKFSEMVDGFTLKLSPGSFVVTKGELIIILAECRSDLLSPQELGLKIQKILHNHDPSLNIYIGIGHKTTGIDDFARSYKEARYAVKIGQTLQKNNFITSYSDLGVYKLLGKIEDKQDLHHFIEQTIGPLIRYDEAKGTDLLVTLDSFLNNGCNIQKTAQSMFIHANTVNYRMQRISELLDVNLKDSFKKLELEMAFKIREMINY